MSKVFLVDVPNEFGIRGLIGDGKLLKFKFNGVCIGEFPIDYNVSTMQEVDVISVLVSGTQVELAFNTNQTFTKKTSLIGLADIAKKLNNLNGLIFMGRREGQHGQDKYSQYIYAFIKGSVNPSVL